MKIEKLHNCIIPLTAPVLSIRTLNDDESAYNAATASLTVVDTGATIAGTIAGDVVSFTLSETAPARRVVTYTIDSEPPAGDVVIIASAAMVNTVTVSDCLKEYPELLDSPPVGGWVPFIDRAYRDVLRDISEMQDSEYIVSSGAITDMIRIKSTISSLLSVSTTEYEKEIARLQTEYATKRRSVTYRRFDGGGVGVVLSSSRCVR